MITHLNAIKCDIFNWLESVRDKNDGWGKWKYNNHMKRPYSPVASAYAIWILDMYNELDSLSKQQRSEAISYLQSVQDPKTGYFIDKLVSDTDKESDKHTWEHVWASMTDAYDGLVRLKAKALYPLPQKRFTDLSSIDSSEWTRTLDWSNPWLMGWQWSQTLLAFRETLANSPLLYDNHTVSKAFDVLEDEVLDLKNGLPTKKGCSDAVVGMAGLFKLLFAYNDFEREYPYPEQAIDSILKLQKENGEFGSGGDMCINWDSVWVLRELDKRLKGSYKRQEITNSFNLLADCLMSEYRKNDGGFAFHRDHCLELHMSIRVSNPYPEGDILGTLQSLFCLSYADEYNN